MSISPINDVLTSAVQGNQLFNIINNQPVSAPTDIFNTILNSHQWVNPKDRIHNDPSITALWLQYPNDIISKKAASIVNYSDSDDVKVQKIQEWVVNNIEYMSDQEQYGYEELWVPPVMLLAQGKGDCEDGAFLIMSLALNAGVDPSRLRFYGGEVEIGDGAATGGHGWVAYKRESDDAWVPVDFSYYPQLCPMDCRIPLADDERYINQYFIFEVGQIIISDVNRVRQPNIYNPGGYIEPNVLFPNGILANTYA